MQGQRAIVGVSGYTGAVPVRPLQSKRDGAILCIDLQHPAIAFQIDWTILHVEIECSRTRLYRDGAILRANFHVAVDMDKIYGAVGQAQFKRRGSRGFYQ